MSWQKCPICNGEGQLNNNGISSAVFRVCPTCHGSRIINELTGLPPIHPTPHPLQEINEITRKKKLHEMDDLERMKEGERIPTHISDEQKESEIKDIIDRTEALIQQRRIKKNL